MNSHRKRRPRRRIPLLIQLAASAALVCACADAPSHSASEDSSGSVHLEIAGTYVDQYGTTQTITASAWSDSFGDAYHVLSYTNAQDFLIAQNDVGNAFNASLYSRFDWTRFNSDLYYCQTDYDAPDIATAMAATADRANPAASGCDVIADFAWTNLTPPAGP